MRVEGTNREEEQGPERHDNVTKCVTNVANCRVAVMEPDWILRQGDGHIYSNKLL